MIALLLTSHTKKKNSFYRIQKLATTIPKQHCYIVAVLIELWNQSTASVMVEFRFQDFLVSRFYVYTVHVDLSLFCAILNNICKLQIYYNLPYLSYWIRWKRGRMLLNPLLSNISVLHTASIKSSWTWESVV